MTKRSTTANNKFIFYRRKLRDPLEIMAEGTRQIAARNLDFEIKYGCLDEMGDLCRSFENMRAALYENSKDMWNMLEERRLMQASVSSGRFFLTCSFIPLCLAISTKSSEILSASFTADICFRSICISSDWFNILIDSVYCSSLFNILTKKSKKLFVAGEDGHMGIGLSISRLLCQKQGGNLELSSRLSGSVPCPSL